MSRPVTGPRRVGNRYVRCVVCDRAVTINNFTTHLNGQHPDRLGPRKDFYVEIEDQPSGPARRGRRPGRALAVPESASPELPPLGPEDLDAITLSVVGQLAEPAGSIPVRLLPAIFAWREATAIFLRSVSER